MNDSTQSKLRKLGERMRQGVGKLRPVSQKHLAEVQKAVEKQWHEQQATRAKSPSKDSSNTQSEHKRQDQKQQKSQSQSNSEGHSHGH